jgi:cytochrome c-type biogenesis protein CcmH
MRSILWTLVVVLSLVALSPASGQEAPIGAANWDLVGEPAGPPLTGPELDRLTEEVALTMRCPVCQGLSIADSPTALAIAMKSEVREMLAKGYSESQVLEYFEQSYGEFIRLEPKAKGFNLLVWIAPLAALLGGLLFLAVRMKRPAKVELQEATSAESPSQSELETYRERVRREVAS